MSDIHDDAFVTSFPIVRLHLAVVADHGFAVGEAVRDSVARIHVIQHHLAEWSGRAPVLVDQAEHARLSSGFYASIYRFPADTAEVRHFDAHDNVGAFPNLRRGSLHIHIFDVLLAIAAHAIADDVEKCEDSRTSLFDYGLIHVVEGSPSRSAAVDHRSDPVGEAQLIGEHRAAVKVAVRVQVNQSGRNVAVRRRRRLCVPAIQGCRVGQRR